jgi:peptidoglycan/xylan/chitin deacetylase (PgdA/CDA1 family)
MQIYQDESHHTLASEPGSALLKSGIRRLRLKAALGQLVYRSGMYKLAWRHRAVIVLFHRVDDRYPENPITCSRAQFAAFCDFFARYFKVVTLGELLERLERRADISRRLVITFDDGYRDNYEVAAAELRKRGLPACFFIPTGFVGSDRSAPGDARRSIRSEWMNWDEVRSLFEQNFELGAHTITHPDLGRVSGAEAEQEIAGSKARLEAEAGTRIRYFAYPFGGADQITEENRTIVRQVGFSCCLSAHGGVVRAADSPFRLRRAPINMWYLSPYQFGFEAMRFLL